jgi:hypothetical protein
MTAAVFCERWHDGEHRPGGVISESVARHRDERGQQYMVVLGEQEQPDALIEVNWSLDFLGTWFLDDKLRRNLNYLFLRVDPKLFSRTDHALWEFPDDTVRDLDTATKVTTLSYNRDGVVHEAIDDSVAGTVEVIARPAARRCADCWRVVTATPSSVSGPRPREPTTAGQLRLYRSKVTPACPSRWRGRHQCAPPPDHARTLSRRG